MAETIPDVITPASLADYLAVMTRAVFQAGVRWQQIAEHWDAYLAAFENFDPSRVALYGELDIERVLQTPGIMRSARKVRGTIANATALLQADHDYGFQNYLRSFTTYAELVRDFKKRFSFMGEMNVWYVLFRTGEPVPRFEEWIVTIPGDHPRMREMVDRAREAGRSPERSG